VNPVHILLYRLFNIYFNIILESLCRCVITQKSAILICFVAEPWNHAWFKWCTYKTCLRLCFLACVLHSRQSHYPWLDHLVTGLCDEEYKYEPTISLYCFFRQCLTWRPNMSCSTLFSNFARVWAVSKFVLMFTLPRLRQKHWGLTLSLYSLLSLRDQVIHPYEIAGKIGVTYVTWQTAREKIHIRKVTSLPRKRFAFYFFLK
jgi:hypothetical protein